MQIAVRDSRRRLDRRSAPPSTRPDSRTPRSQQFGIATLSTRSARSRRRTAPRRRRATARRADHRGALQTAASANDRAHRRAAESVGPRVGAELQTNAIIAILISFVVTLIYLAFRFEWRFGVAAVIATAHDILTTLAFLAMMRLEVSLTVVAAILTVIGYSLNDTIIIFDRVRENLKKAAARSRCAMC